MMTTLSSPVRIGVFDSGIGGKSVADEIIRHMPDAEVLFRNDAAHVPYGSRTPEQIWEFIVPIFEQMIAEGCEVIVLACNTVTTTLIERLRQTFSVPFVGIEPMLKPAAVHTRSGVIAVCATPTTLSSPRYAFLKKTYANDVRVIEPDCHMWARLIEDNAMTSEQVAGSLAPALDAGADVVVLACTHYHWIEEDIQELCKGRALVLQPTEAIIAQLERVLQRS